MSHPGLLRAIDTKAVKAHECSNCLEPIPKGNKYMSVSGVWEGGFERYKQCKSCWAIVSEPHKISPNLDTEFFPSLEQGGVSSFLAEFDVDPYEVANLYGVSIEYVKRMIKAKR